MGNYKKYRKLSKETLFLFDLKNDPYEFNNLANNPTFRTKRDHLFQAMREFQKEINDPFLDPENIDFFVKEMADPARQPNKKSEETWSHLDEFYRKHSSPE